LILYPARETTWYRFVHLESTAVSMDPSSSLSTLGILSISGFTLANVIIAIIVVFVTAFLYYVFFLPYNRVKDLTSIGYSFLKEEDRRNVSLSMLVEELRRRRKVGDLPPVYPNGWFALLESSQLKAGQVKPVDALGENFAVFRGTDGTVSVLDAYCPHMGANLAVGGRVHSNNCLECPFHGWMFSGETGKCVAIPYAKKVPEFASVKKWTSCEVNGFVLVWYHAEGEGPSWTPPVHQGISDGWTYRGRTEHIVNAHVQEIPENGGDIAHLATVHTPPFFTGTDLRNMYSPLWSWAKHIFTGNWQQEPAPNQHVGVTKLHHGFHLGKALTLVSLDMEARQIGPSLVYMDLDTSIGRALIIQTLLPVEPLIIKVVHTLYGPPSLLQPYAKFMLYGEAIMIERDIMIWNHKRYESKPLLVKEDQLVAKHRRWYAQFYSEHSPRFGQRKDTLEW